MIQSQRQQLNHQQETTKVWFTLPLDDRLNSLDKKSDRLLQKVLAIQQQIQSYTQTQNKQFLPISEYFQININQNSMIENTFPPRRKSFLQLCNQSQQHQQYLKKMVNLGKSKVKMIENLQQHISSLQNKFNHSNNNSSKQRLQLLLQNDRVQSSQLTYLQQSSIQEERHQLDLKFTNYNDQKNHMLKQSKTQRFSFRQLKSLMKKHQIHEQHLQQFQGQHNHNDLITITTINSPRIASYNYQHQQHQSIIQEGQPQSLQLQLQRVKQQFANYQQRTSKQLQSYKQRLNNVVLEKEILRKELDTERYDRLKDKLFSNNNKGKSDINSDDGVGRLRRVLSYTTLGNQQQYVSNTNELSDRTFFGFVGNDNKNNTNLKQLQSTKTSNKNDKHNQQYQQHHVINSKQQQQQQIQQQQDIINNENDNNHIEDLQRLREQLSMRYIEQNQQLSQLREKLAQSEQVIEQLRAKLTQQQSNLIKQRILLQSNHHLYLQQLQQLNKLLQQKQSLINTHQQQLEQLTYETNQYKQEIQEMASFIIKIKEENQQQQQEIDQYKAVVEEFLEEVGGLREEIGKKNNEIQQYGKQLQQAGRINNQCYEQIQVLKSSLQQHSNIIHLQQQQLTYKQSQIIHLQSLIKTLEHQKQQLQQKHQSFITSQQQLNLNSTDKDEQITQLLMQNQLEKQQQQQLLHNIERLTELLQRQQQRVDELIMQHGEEIEKLVKLKQIQISQLNIQHGKIICQKQQQLQQMQQNMMVLKSSINEQVQKQVNYAIRTFLRYRKHTCRLQSNTCKIIIYHNQLYYQTKEKINNTSQQNKTTIINSRSSNITTVRDSNINNNTNNYSTTNNNMKKHTQMLINTTVTVTAANDNHPVVAQSDSKLNNGNNSSSNRKRLTLRKLIDEKFNYKRNTDTSISMSEKEQQLIIKMNLTLKLIEFAIQFLSQQRPVNKSASKPSSKKLPSLLPEHIQIEYSHSICQQEQQSLNKQSSLQLALANFLLSIRQNQQTTNNNHLNEYKFTFSPNESNTNKSQSIKKDKTLIYSSPQVLLSMNESEHSYTWTLGVIIDQMLNHKPYYSKIEDIISRKDNYKFNNLQHYENTTTIDHVTEILQQMLKKNFKQRPSLSCIYKQLVRIVNSSDSSSSSK